MTFREYAKDNLVILDGGMGSLLEKYGIAPGEAPEMWNITHPGIITDIHRAYFDAGSNVINTNTFGANIIKYDQCTLEKIVSSALECAKLAREKSVSKKEKFIAIDIGPTGKLLKPFGNLDFEDAYRSFYQTVKLGEKYGADLIVIETMNDSYETKAALLAAKEASMLPVVVTNAYGSDGKLLSGASPEAMVALLEGMGADFIGVNCSLGPAALLGVAERIINASSVPCVFKPNAGLPQIINGKTVYNLPKEDFAKDVSEAVKLGARMVGGCCGTTPEYIKELSDKLEGVKPREITAKHNTVITSYCKAHNFNSKVTLIGERINPTGKKRLRTAVEENDVDYIVGIALDEEELGADVLDVNVGVPGIDESQFLPKIISAIQYSVSTPLSLDTSNPDAMEAALRVYNGKALINSVNGKAESMSRIFPLVKKYGGVVIALTLDESGIPDTADGRVAIARKILAEAKTYGIDKRDIIFDPLAMAVSVDRNSAKITLEAVRRIRYELGCHTSLGVSNISFGLPKRDAINSAFFAMAVSSGLSAAIMNPSSVDMMKTYYASVALLGLDENFEKFISVSESFESAGGTLSAASVNSVGCTNLSDAIIKGLRESATLLTRELLKCKSAMNIIGEDIIPALDIVGKGFEEGKIFLPGLLLSAETAKYAFEEIKRTMQKATAKRSVSIIIATVKGDIHDIGKNIVKLLLENYGFEVIDLGKDVSPHDILEAAKKHAVDIVALSALMTTTVPAMEETVALIKGSMPDVKVIVGGAVLNSEYAKQIGADFYGKDAISAVRYAEALEKIKQGN